MQSNSIKKNKNIFKNLTIFTAAVVKNIIFVLACNKHPYVTERLLNMKPWCEYDVSEPHIICDFCHQVKYLFNYKATRFCLKKIPGSVFENITTPFQYFKCMLGPGCFFYLEQGLA